MLKVHIELNPSGHKYDQCKKKNLLVEVGKEIESSLDVDKKIVCTTIQKKTNLSSLYHKNK